MMADELLNAQDLITAKKHDTFHSEVITGKNGGVSTGANIDYATNAVTGQVQKTLPATIDGLDWSYVGKFADGVTFTKSTDFAIDANGTQWIYVGASPFPVVVPAGTVPTAPDYQVVHVNNHSILAGRNDAGAHPASSISRGASTVDADIASLEADIAVAESDIAELNNKVSALESKAPIGSLFKLNSKKGQSPWGVAGPVNNLGDSISHGAFAKDVFYRGWKSIMARMIKAEFGGESYDGFVTLLSLGTGGEANPISADVHGINFIGTWSANGQTTVNGQAAYNGQAMYSTTQGNAISAFVPTFQSKSIVWYLQQPGGGEITITMNGVSPVVINTNGVLSQQFRIVDNVDNGSGNFTLRIEKTDATANPVDICGIGYVDNTITPCMHNFSQSGRRLRYVSEQTINALTNNAAALFLSLGINDAFDAQNDQAGYGAEFTQRINWIIQYVNSSGCKLVVNDFCWTYGKDNYVRKELKRAADETDGVYIPLPDMIKNDGTTPNSAYLLATGLWYDQSHPTPQGHKWVAESIAKTLNLTCTSATDAWSRYDYWIPFNIPAGTSNVSTAPSAVSAYKLNGNEVLLRYYVKKSDGASPMPIANYQLQAGWRTFAGGQTPPFKGVKSNIDVGGVINNSTSAYTSSLNVAESGALLLRVTATYIGSQRGNASMAIEMFVG